MKITASNRKGIYSIKRQNFCRLFIVIAPGEIRDQANDADFFVLTHDANTGTIIWADQLDFAQETDQVGASAATKGRVFAAGSATPVPDNAVFLIRAYDGP